MHQVFLGWVPGRAVREVTLALWVVTSVDAHQRQSVGTRRTHTYVAIEHLNHVKQCYGSWTMCCARGRVSTALTDWWYMYFETRKFIRGIKGDSGINMTAKIKYNRRFGQFDPRKNDPKYMYFHRLGEIFEKISSSISVLICPGPVITMTGTPESIPGSTKWDDRENTIWSYMYMKYLYFWGFVFFCLIV